MANAWYNEGKAKIPGAAAGGIDWVADTIQVVLVGTGYTFDADHTFNTNILPQEISTTGYVGGFAGAGRKTLGTKAITQNNANDRAEFSAANISWSAIGVAAGYQAKAMVVIKKGSADDTTAKAIAYIDTPTIPIFNSGDFNVTWNAAGVIDIA